MNKPGKYVIVVLMLLMALAGHGEQTGQDEKSKESYGVIIQRNIFSKDRSPRRPVRVDVRPAEPNTVAAPDIAFVFILRGVAIDSNKKLAFIENQSSGELFLASIGEQVDGMVIKEIKADRVVFDKNQTKVEIMVGMDMSGVVPGAAAYTTTSRSLGSSDPNSPAIQGTDESEILRKMLERRKKELD
ncbi:MAG: hypothetical protein FVQ82_03675 [Planctomycetes bacterium]|nr:hypothetical protein [Planctomycetota bacterium]